MSSKLHYAFTCPKCGFHGWGTSNCDKPFDQWFGHCNASGCGFSWHRETADHVYLKESTQTRINQTMMPKEESIELAEKCGAKPYPGKLPTDEIFIEFTYSELLAYTSAIEEKYQAENERLAKQVSDAATMWTAQCTENIKYQEIIGMLREELDKCAKKVRYYYKRGAISNEALPIEIDRDVAIALSATQATADAREAEVKARAFIEAAQECREWKSAAKTLRSNNDRTSREFAYETVARSLEAMAAELRNQQPAQPRKPCTCDGWCDGLCLEKEGKRK